MKTTYTIEIQRHNVTPAQFLAYVRRRLKATGGDAFCGCLDLNYFAAGSEPNYDTEHDGTHCISRSKPYDMQTYIREDGRLYNEICEFEFDDDKTGYGYYYLIDADADETTETTPAAEPETETETTERAAEPYYLPAAAAQEDKTPGLNPMCRECTRCGIDCKGTTCKTFTGCIYREWLGSHKRSETPAHITAASTAKLLDYWDYVRRLSYSAATQLTRSWVLDEIERRDPVGYERWVDDDTPGDYDATLRSFIRCDGAHVAWLCPQTATTWRPGDAREGARA